MEQDSLNNFDTLRAWRQIERRLGFIVASNEAPITLPHLILLIEQATEVPEDAFARFGLTSWTSFICTCTSLHVCGFVGSDQLVFALRSPELTWVAGTNNSAFWRPGRCDCV